ncbi:MAG: hypothetical protein ACI9F9_000114 [Candidatus Paceibacteria bacterium]|jgi:hypothetical protein
MSSEVTGALWARVKNLELQVEGYHLSPMELVTNTGFRRLTTEVCLQGGGFTGKGEEVAWGAEHQQAFRDRGSNLSLEGTQTLGEFSERLDGMELSPDSPPDKAWLDYRRWAFESAALDLALRQAGNGIDDQLGRRAKPLHFAVSLGLSDFGEIERRQAIHSNMRFKLDATPDWSAELCARLAQTEAVDVVDFKGAYSGTPVDVAADIDLYSRVLDAMPDVVVEDPHNRREILNLLQERNAKVAWDAPIHSMADVDAMPLVPQALNIKPSRFGTLRKLFEAYEQCAGRGLPTYGGGQFELGVGRRQIQLLAALFHAENSNDVAPGAYHRLEDPEPKPASPLALKVQAVGFDLQL